ncbi:type 1 glutamine amidotransferase domain-containing protein [Piscinibacter terrae]|uniref:ThiJ/pfpI-family protein n=1 Tax=Piscinibacter terrae TaxID=2496871 RepID=A0A3N7HTA6_9BURK|nr:type 1 glutamine amidotransferase domain-containing protein [Albitalea terrae]RQP25003.1 thiJ/pfpI-family protein [Albitalea terrae]
MDVLIPIPSHDFDPTEAAITWRVLTDAGIRVRFATPDGRPGEADPHMLSGEGLDLWGFIPGLNKLKLLGLALRADARGRAAYAQMQQSPEFRQPLRWSEIRCADFDGLALPGGHRAQGMRQYLEDTTLQAKVAEFFDAGQPVAAICHGVVLAARSVSARTGRSVLHGRKTTALTWKLEQSAWMLMRFLGRFWNAAYYRTYEEARGEPAGHRSVQAEVTRALASPADFMDVSPSDFRRGSGLFRDTPTDSRCAFVVTDGRYVSARWPGDAHLFARTFAEVVKAASSEGAARGARIA